MIIVNFQTLKDLREALCANHTDGDATQQDLSEFVAEVERLRALTLSLRSQLAGAVEARVRAIQERDERGLTIGQLGARVELLTKELLEVRAAWKRRVGRSYLPGADSPARKPARQPVRRPRGAKR